jgi:Putative zincin peptidase
VAIQIGTFAESYFMAMQVEDLENQSKYRQILSIPYDDLIPFIFDYLKRKSGLTIFFWSACLLFLGMAIRIRINITGYYPSSSIFWHSLLGLVIIPLLSVPVHELLHIIPYFISGARNIRVGMDLRQYIFYVTAHRYVATPLQFRIVAIIPFLIINISLILLIIFLPGLWKWSLSLFLFVHTTMCAGDFALLNFYSLKKGRKIFTWDDADKKIAYFYEEI